MEQRGTKALRILVVDDVLDNRELAVASLRLEGHDLATACNGAEALSLVREQAGSFDAILMDLQMPVMDGIEATRILRGHELTRRIPVICVTGNPELASAENALFDACVAKPYRRGDLLAALARVLGEG